MDGLLRNSLRFENFVYIQGQVRSILLCISNTQYFSFWVELKIVLGHKRRFVTIWGGILGLGLLICTVNGELLTLKDKKRCFTFFSAELEQYHLILHGTYYVPTYHSSTLQCAVVCTIMYMLFFLGAIKVSTIHLYFIKLTG